MNLNANIQIVLVISEDDIPFSDDITFHFDVLRGAGIKILACRFKDTLIVSHRFGFIQ